MAATGWKASGTGWISGSSRERAGDLADSGGMKPPPSQPAGAWAPPRRGAAAALFACLLAACGASGDRASAAPQAAAERHPADPGPHLVDPRPLPGAGAVAFGPEQDWIAWAAGEEVRVLALGDRAGAGERRVPVGSLVADLGVAPDGALWVIADVPQLWRDGAPACRAEGVEADRLLAVDGEGAVVAAYSHSDGTGMLRQQVWLDAQCDVVDERIAPLPAGVADAQSDPGAPLGRATLRALHPDPTELAQRLSAVRLPAGAGVELAVRVSDDGRWWVLDGAQGRTLWRRAP